MKSKCRPTLLDLNSHLPDRNKESIQGVQHRGRLERLKESMVKFILTYFSLRVHTSGINKANDETKLKILPNLQLSGTEVCCIAMITGPKYRKTEPTLMKNAVFLLDTVSKGLWTVSACNICHNGFTWHIFALSSPSLIYQSFAAKLSVQMSSANGLFLWQILTRLV